MAIARALALRPKVILFDEPTSALDPELVTEVLDVIAQLARDGATLVIVTHEIGLAREIADTVVFMDRGAIVEQGPPKEVLTARRIRVRRASCRRCCREVPYRTRLHRADGAGGMRRGRGPGLVVI